MFTRRIAVLFGSLAIVITLTYLLLGPTPVFTYDFEDFFAEDDPELLFYERFREVFENDNDYLLIALGNSPNVFQPDFLDQALAVENHLKELENVESVLSLLSAEERIISPFGIRKDNILQWQTEALLTRSKQALLEDSSWTGGLLANEGKYLIMIVRNTQQITKDDGDVLYHSIIDQLRGSGIADYRIAGKIKAQAEFVSLLQDEFAFFLSISFLLVLGWLYLIFRSFWGVLIPIIVLAFGFFWAVSFLLVSGGELDVLAVMQPPILLVIGLSGMVHLLTVYIRNLRHGMPKEQAIQHTFKELFIPVFLTSLTTAVGFFSLTISDVISLERFGWFTGMGVLWMFLAILFILPLALYVFPPFASKPIGNSDGYWQRGLGWVFLRIIRWRWVVHGVFVVLSLSAAIAVSLVKTNGFILDNLPSDHALVQDFDFFDKTFGGSKPLEFHIQVGQEKETLLDYEILRDLDQLEQFIQSTFGTGTVVSPLTLVKSLNKAQNQGSSKAFRFPTPAQYDRMLPLIDRYVAQQPFPILSADLKKGRITTYMADIGSLKGEELEREFDAYLEEHISPKRIEVRMTGTSYLIDRSHRQVTAQLLSGLGFAFLCVALLTGLLFRSWRMALIGLIPNLVPLLWMGGLMYLLDVNFNLSTAIIFAVAFGIAVDDSIHFITKLGAERNTRKSLIYGLKSTYFTTGKALVLTTIILSSGFLVLTGSDFQITFYAGLLIGLSLIFALAADILWLPLLILPLKKVWLRH